MFNYKKLAVAQAEAQGAKAALALAKELYERLLKSKDEEIVRLREANDSMRGKISLMETIIMPLSSKAGAAYQEAVTPTKKANFRTTVEPPVSEWQRHKRAVEAQIEKEYAEADARQEK